MGVQFCWGNLRNGIKPLSHSYPTHSRWGEGTGVFVHQFPSVMDWGLFPRSFHSRALLVCYIPRKSRLWQLNPEGREVLVLLATGILTDMEESGQWRPMGKALRASAALWEQSVDNWSRTLAGVRIFFSGTAVIVYWPLFSMPQIFERLKIVVKDT